MRCVILACLDLLRLVCLLALLRFPPSRRLKANSQLTPTRDPLHAYTMDYTVPPAAASAKR